MGMTIDEIRSTLFSAGLRRLRDDTLDDKERIIWQGQPNPLADMLMFRFLWWIAVPWLALTFVAISRHWIDESIMFFLLMGAMMIGGPFVMYLYDLQTLFVITNRRALILRTAWGKRETTSTPLEDMDKDLEILDIGHGAAHLNFASNRSNRSPDADYTGRYGFRSLRNVEEVRAILEKALGRSSHAPAKAKKARLSA